MVLANGPAAAGNPRPSPASAPTEARWIHRSARLPDGRSEWSLDLPEGAESLVIHLAGGPKAALRQALEALRGFEDWPAERLRNELLALEVEFLLAMAGDGEPPAADRFARALAGLAVIGEPGGALTVPVEVAKDFPVRALLEILGVENGAGGPVRRPDETELEALLAGRKGTGWGSARATAEAVRILAGAVRLSDERTASLRIRFGAALVGACRLDAETGPTVIVPRELLRPGRERLVFEKGGGLPVDCALSIGIHSGAPLRDGPIRVERAWRSTGEQPAAPHRGEIVTVALTVRSAETRERVVVECPVPAGSRALSGGPNPPVGVHREIRPDRVLFYLPKVGEKPVVLIQELLVTHGGEFLFPRAVAYPVDRPEERSESGEEMLTFR